MRMRKNAIVLAIIVSLVVLVGCSAGEPKGTKGTEETVNVANEADTNFNTTGYPIVNKPITLTMMSIRNVSNAPFDEMPVLNKQRERTNIEVVWNTIPAEGAQERKNLLFASGEDLPDAFMKFGLTRQDELTYGMDGDILIPLNDLIDKYAPNFKAFMDADADIGKMITLPDGNIYTLPTISTVELGTGMITYINKVWLDRLGLPVPGTPEQFYETLKAFKEQDPNGNGSADEMPMSGDTGYLTDLPIIMGAWGIASNGGMFDKETGEVRFVPADDRYKEALQFAAKLFKEQLISSQMLTNNGQMYQTEAKTAPMGVITTPAFWTIAENLDDWVVLPPLKGPYGDQIWDRIQRGVRFTGAFGITKNNPHPEATMRWVDYWYSEEGSRQVHHGIEGENYTVHADNTWTYSDFVLKNPDGLTPNEALAKLSPGLGDMPFNWGYSHEFLFREKDQFAGQTAHLNNELYLAKNYGPKFIKPVRFNYTAEEQQRATILETDIRTYVDQMRFKFISGAESFDNWDNYVAQLEKMGSKELTELVRKAW